MEIVSVVMVIWRGDSFISLKAAVDSVLLEVGSEIEIEIVLVVNGEVGKDVREYLLGFDSKLLRLIELNSNMGLAVALNIGVECARSKYILRLDPDDRFISGRVRKQYEIIKKYDVGVVGGWQLDVNGGSKRLKVCPSEHVDIENKFRWYCVLGHTSLMFDKSKVCKYREDVGKLEDYYFHIDNITSGVKYRCIQSPVVEVYYDDNQARRRGGWSLLKNDIRLRKFMWKSGYIGFIDFIAMVAVYSVFRMSPIFLKKVIYRATRS